MQGSANLNVMIKAARKAGRSLVKDFREVENLQVSMKGAGDFVSRADREAERIIKEELMGGRPTYGWLGEETGETEGQDPTRRWIVDPLDGTTNFLHGLPHWAVSIALEHKGEWKKALQLLLAVDLIPTLPPAIRAENSFQMARLNQQLGNYKESEKNFRSSIDAYKQLDPPQPESLLRVYNSLAILYMHLGNYAEAEQLYTTLLKQTDTFSGFYTTLQQNLAGLYEETLRYDEAQKLLEAVV